jgi:hypothetical protein
VVSAGCQFQGFGDSAGAVVGGAVEHVGEVCCGLRPLSLALLLTLCLGEGSSFLVPAWMVAPEAPSVKIVDVPRLSLARLLDLRAFLVSES